jgi:hypothetical protein
VEWAHVHLSGLDKVEDPKNKVRVIVSVARLKEGWDVKNLSGSTWRPGCPLPCPAAVDRAALVGGDHLRALSREEPGDSPSDASSGARYDRDSVVKSMSHWSLWQPRPLAGSRLSSDRASDP